MELLRIDPSHPLYSAELDLRFRVLREPLGMTRAQVLLEGEDEHLHLALVDGARVLGCVLVRPSGARARLRQMAVEPASQRRGLGAQLVGAAEDAAREAGAARMELHARETARGFYERLGYQAVGQTFSEVGLPHVRMERELAPAAGARAAAPLPPAFAQAYDPETFRAQGHALVDQLADHLRAAQARALPVLPWSTPEEELESWPDALGAAPSATLPALIEKVLARSNHLHHPRYVGHQVTAPLPAAALLHLVTALLNNGTGIYEMGPAANAMEHGALRLLARAAGLPAGADGVLTSGGSIGNLTALLAARQAKAGGDAWAGGAHQGPPLTVLASSETHYSVARAVQIMGFGAGGVTAVPVDARFRLRPDALLPALRAAERAGRRPIAVVASAGSTSTGAFDPLEPIADFCAAHGLWLHVDGAHGAAAVLSPRYADQCRGIERADSVVWDAHKMMLLPALVTAVLFREGARSYDTFSQQAHYLFSGNGRGEWWNSGLRTVECTKRMMGLELYGALALHGTALFGEYVTRMFDLGRAFAALVRAEPDFELPTEPDCNIVCFRHRPAGATDLDALQERIRRRVLESGAFYLVQTRLPAGVFLRVTLINPLTDERDLAALLEAVRAAAREVEH